MNLVVGYVGLTHLGINYAVASAIKGFRVVCYDENEDLILSLQKQKVPFFEKNLNKNLKKKFKYFKFTSKIKDLSKCDLVFISKDVPTNSLGKSNLNPIKKLISRVAKSIRKNCSLIILCQVPPGFCRSVNWPKHNLFYQVETLIFSKAQQRALYPERIIVGKSKNNLSKKYFYYLKKFKCPVIEMNYESAELAKISINIFLISQITSSNILSEIAENVGAKWKLICHALKLDKRIGKFAYLKPGLGISGGNLERDLETLRKFSKFNTIYESYSNNVKNISDYRKNWIYKKFLKIRNINKNIKRIGILGLAYKEGTNSIKNSPSILFINKVLSNKKIKLNVYDPKIKKLYKLKKLKICKNIEQVVSQSDLLIIATPWKNFKKIDISQHPNIKKIIDPYNHLDLMVNKIQKSKYIGMEA